MGRRGQTSARKCVDRPVGVTFHDRGGGGCKIQLLERLGMPGTSQLSSKGLHFLSKRHPCISNPFSLPRNISAHEDVVSRSVRLLLDALQPVKSAELLGILAIENHGRLVLGGEMVEETEAQTQHEKSQAGQPEEEELDRRAIRAR